MRVDWSRWAGAGRGRSRRPICRRSPPVEPVAVKNQSAEVEVKVRNYGTSPRAGMELNLSVIRPTDPPLNAGDAGRKLNKEPLVVTVGARSSTTIRVPVIFKEIGSHVLS